MEHSDSCLYIICRILLRSNHMIFLEQFGINKHLHIFKRPQIALTQWACAVLLVFEKFILAYLFQIALKVITITNRIVFDAVCLLFTRHRSRPLAKPGRLENAAKSGAFSKRYGFI